ncbi:MAG: AAA family ATPase [Deinococcus-Thermus bacterium]|jgi:aminoglycoside phosphotransferase family enzyme/predicted kinase|nr:AAA family ATPase [Deinococcota bacterium]
MTTDHDALVAALDAGGPFGVDEVTRIDTHAARVFLVGELAYKLKRPVRFSFLDFSKVEGRRDALENELRLNRRTAPELYRRVLPVTRADGGFALDGDGEVVDWLLEMRRFPQERKLDRIAAEGPLAPALARELGSVVADFHRDAEPRLDKGGHDGMHAVVAGNREDLDAAIDGVFASDEVAAVDRAARRALERYGRLLDERRDAGLVRHCHGDLHLGNIVRLDSGVVPFDCIEFSEDIACADTMYDLAFLLMDLLERDQRAAAWTVLDAYLDRIDDLDGLAPLPFFMAVRATIRAKVVGLGIEDLDADADKVATARRYLAFARALEPAPAPRLVAIGGVSGTGKTTLAHALAPAFDPAPGAVVLRSDVERKRLWGVAPTDTLPQEAYAPEVSHRVFERLRARARRALGAGTSVVVDAVHGRAEERRDLEAIAGECGVRFDGLWLEAPVDRLVERVATRTGDASDADEAIVRRQLTRDTGPIHWRRLEASVAPGLLAERARAVLDLDDGALAAVG